MKTIIGFLSLLVLVCSINGQVIKKGVEGIKDGVGAAGDAVVRSTDYVGDKLVDAKDAVKEKTAPTYNKVAGAVKDAASSVGDGFNAAGEYIGDKYDGVKESIHEKTSPSRK